MPKYQLLPSKSVIVTVVVGFVPSFANGLSSVKKRVNVSKDSKSLSATIVKAKLNCSDPPAVNCISESEIKKSADEPCSIYIQGRECIRNNYIIIAIITFVIINTL